ncbi:MAG: hypothetical protein JWP91_2596 [Fibrobacteres bacterium]|nr:hypothetical protein [Fibrobacterota bacterium]
MAEHGSVETLRQISPIAYAFERFFHMGSRTSPERLFGPTRVDIQQGYDNPADRRRAARARGKRIEAYLVAWIGVEAVAVAYGTLSPDPWVIWGFMGVLVLRIADIIQITGNHSLFDRLKFQWRHYYIENTVRTILLSLINYVELVVCFGFIYCILGRNGRFLDLKDSPFDGYYFSGATQLTIGYGDITPSGPLKYLALFQGFIGFLFTILILGRFISLLPESKEEADP